MRILVTGASGLIGGNLCQSLSLAGHEVLAATRVNDFKVGSSETISLDWYQHESLRNKCRGIDLIVHAAGINAHDSFLDPVAAFNFNALATKSLVTAAVASNVERFIYLSTAHVYRNPLIGDITEETYTENNHPYAISKLAGEEFVLNAISSGTINGAVLRLSNLVGPPVSPISKCWTLLANDICRQAIEHNRIKIKSASFQVRDFISMREFCRLLSFFISHDLRFVENPIFNVGSGTSSSIKKIADLVKSRARNLFNIEPKIEEFESAIANNFPYLNYKIDKLEREGFIVNPDISDDIDDLLFFCSNTFS